MARKAGYVRDIDPLGRLVIPKQYRKEMDIPEEGGTVVVTCTNGVVTVAKAEKSCIFCGETLELTEFKNRSVCLTCLAEINKK